MEDGERTKKEGIQYECGSADSGQRGSPVSQSPDAGVDRDITGRVGRLNLPVLDSQESSPF